MSTGHVAGIAVRHPLIVAVGNHYGVTVATCVPADPEIKSGFERTVQIAKADLVPTDSNGGTCATLGGTQSRTANDLRSQSILRPAPGGGIFRV